MADVSEWGRGCISGGTDRPRSPLPPSSQTPPRGIPLSGSAPPLPPSARHLGPPRHREGRPRVPQNVGLGPDALTDDGCTRSVNAQRDAPLPQAPVRHSLRPPIAAGPPRSPLGPLHPRSRPGLRTPPFFPSTRLYGTSDLKGAP